MVGLRKTSDYLQNSPEEANFGRCASLYLIALGSNQRHGRHGAPAAVLGAAVVALAAAGLRVEQVAPVIRSAPVGPSLRRYANGAALVGWDGGPVALLELLKGIERAFGRRRGQRWGSRVLDLDIVLWSGGVWRSKGLYVPHRLYRTRDFVLTPARAIVPDWRDPFCRFTIGQLQTRLTKPRPVLRGALPNGV